jgi:pyruvate formate lyase activating enzyme
MQIHGINKLTLLDFPEHTACTLFTGGCNFRCPFCQNGSLVLSPQTEPVIDEAWLFEFLKKRRNVLQGVCITGGEPTIQADLPGFICRIRELDYKIKLDTNGYRPDVLAQLLDDGLLDAVAMDIKSSPENYARVCGFEQFRFENIDRSVKLLTEYGRLHPEFYYEFRTTLVRELHTQADMRSIGHWLAETPHYFLQHYEESEYVIHNISGVSSKHEGLAAMSLEEMQEMADIVRKDIPSVQIRGI